MLNPYKNCNQEIKEAIYSFYSKYYNQNTPRRLILGINPGRLGAGATGLPFTDTKRLNTYCDIEIEGISTHEPSSVFVYNVIMHYGGAEHFYNNFYVSSVVPLGFTRINERGNEVNVNYYDDLKLMRSLEGFILEKLREQLGWGLKDDICYCLGTGKNYKFLEQFNKEHQLFERIVPLEHPRYVMQYKSKKKMDYIAKYLDALDL